MTKDKFAVLCEQVLVPRVSDLIRRELMDLHQSLEVISRELIRIGRRLDQLALDGRNSSQGHAD